MPNLKFLGVGAAHIDRRGSVKGAYTPAASNPGTIREEAGGAILNALRTITNLGEAADIVSAIGGDNAGRQIVAAIGAAGINDHCAVFLDRMTASYTALIDADGSLIAGLADMDIYETGLNRHIRSRSVRDLAASANAILIDANIPQNGIENLLRVSAGKPVFAIAVSPSKAIRLKPFLQQFEAIFMNRAEALAITGLADEAGAPECVHALRAAGLNCAIITNGSRALTGYDRNSTLELTPPQVMEIVDVTGAGDAFAAAATIAFCEGKTLGEAMREGTAAAISAISSPSAVPALDRKALDRMKSAIVAPAPLAQAN
jgi:pseudouridine kinase